MISFVLFAAVVLHLGAAGEPVTHAENPPAASQVELWSMLPASSPMPEAIVQLVQRGMTSRVDQYSYEPSTRRRSCVYDGAGRCSDRSSTPMLFFHEEAVQKGSTLPVYFAPAVTAKLGFLRRHVARTIPFKASKLADILAMFHIPSSSSEAADVAATLALCDAAEGGVVCVTSPEDLVERAMALLGTRRRITALASVVPSGGVSLQPYTVLAVRPIAGGSSSDFVVCHPELYPYSVYSCHVSGQASAYAVDMESSYGSGGAVSMVAVCHRNTTSWDPKHKAFEILGSKPGGSPICHFLPYGHLAFGKRGPYANNA